MFKNDFLESLTHVPVWLPAVVWIPVITLLLFDSYFHNGLGLGEYSIIFVGALFAWSLAEYCIHRIIFHAQFSSPFLGRVVFLFHGVHHDYPNDSERLLMPPLAAIPIAFIFWFLFNLLLDKTIAQPFFAFFLVGYLIYDYIHYATHHWVLKSSITKALKKNHMFHHYAEPETYYGVSSPLWDWVFRSL